jgi:hypothetical protein
MLRKELQANENPDPLVRLILKGYQQDLMRRTTYLRAHSEVLTRSQRKKMLQALDDLQEQIEFLKTGTLTSTLPPLQIEQPVADIIKKANYE